MRRCGAVAARATAEAAAHLSRADLATSLVTEMTGLAGTMGRHYALQSGVHPEVAEARLCTKLAGPDLSGKRLRLPH